MQRLWLSLGGGLVIGIAMTLIGGYLAALIISATPRANQDGGGAMAGMFQIGPLIGIISLIAGSVAIWHLSAVPGRTRGIVIAFGVLIAMTVVGSVIALAPRPSPQNPAFKGVNGSLRFEVKFLAPAPAPASLAYDLRKGGETLSGSTLPKEARTEDGATIVPGAFPLHGLEGFMIFGVMTGDVQRDVVSMDLPKVPDPTPWSPWLRMDHGSQVRWQVTRN